MKRLLIILILTFSFQSWTKADDISEFEIEGISIGISLLDLFSLEKINNNISVGENYKNTNFKRMCLDNYGSTYDRFCATFYDDKKKIVSAYQGQLKYEKLNYQKCKQDMKKIDDDLSNLFQNLNKKDWGELIMSGFQEISPDSTYHPITFDFKDNSRVQLGCYNHPVADMTVLKIMVYNAEIRKLISMVAKEKQ